MPRVLIRAAAAIGRDFVALLGLAIVLVGVPMFLMSWWEHESARTAYVAGRRIAVMPNVSLFLASGLLQGITGALLLAAVTHAIVTRLGGGPAGFARSLAAAFQVFVPVALLGAIITLASGLLTAILVIAAAPFIDAHGLTRGMIIAGRLIGVFPGVLLWAVWSVAIPVSVRERSGVFASIRRAMSLARGNYVALLPYAIATTFVSVLLWAVTTGMGDRLPYGHDPVPAALTTATVYALLGLVFAAIEACVYVELRAAKEGASVRTLATIFD